MSAPRRRSGPDREIGTAANAIIITGSHQVADMNQGSSVQPNVVPVRAGYAHARVVRLVGPDQNRGIPLVVVRCAICGREHVHRGFGVRRRPCGGRYELRPIVEVAA